MKQPALFIGHGSPLNAIQDNDFTRALQSLGKHLQTNFAPKAILCVSAHWCTRGSKVTVGNSPRQIYDFGGFPDELYQLSYPCSGSDALAARIQTLNPSITADTTWGIDHGSWCILHHMFPLANVPVVQVSLDTTRSNSSHAELAKTLAPLRNEGVLLIGSGNIVHSFSGFRGGQDAPADPRGADFDNRVKDAILANDLRALIDYESLGPGAQFSVPTLDHYWPLLYALGVREADDVVEFVYEGFQYASMSMRCVRLG